MTCRAEVIFWRLALLNPSSSHPLRGSVQSLSRSTPERIRPLRSYSGMDEREPLRRSRSFPWFFSRSVELQHDAPIDVSVLQFGENMIDIVQPIEMDPRANVALRGEFE